MTYETQNALDEFRHFEADYFDREGKVHGSVYLKSVAEEMFKLINLLEIEILRLERNGTDRLP
jgi:hypothetical protein